jgi:hypothetical protein
MTALVSLFVALGVVVFMHQNQRYTALQQAPTSAPAGATLSVVTRALPSASAVAAEPSAPPQSDSAAPIEEPRVTPDHAVPTHASALPRDGKARPAPKGSKPAAPAKASRVRDKEAEQYGI